jgi:hypothetical protein
MVSKNSQVLTTSRTYGVSNFKNLSLEDLSKLFDVPIASAALCLNVSESYLKRLCRTFHINRWPYRRIESLRIQIDAIKRDLNSDVGQGYSMQYKEERLAQLAFLERELEIIKETGIDETPKNSRPRAVKKRGRPLKAPLPVTEISNSKSISGIDTPAYESNTAQSHPLPLCLSLDIESVQHLLNN